MAVGVRLYQARVQAWPLGRPVHPAPCARGAAGCVRPAGGAAPCQPVLHHSGPAAAAPQGGLRGRRQCLQRPPQPRNAKSTAGSRPPWRPPGPGRACDVPTGPCSRGLAVPARLLREECRRGAGLAWGPEHAAAAEASAARGQAGADQGTGARPATKEAPAPQTTLAAHPQQSRAAPARAEWGPRGQHNVAEGSQAGEAYSAPQVPAWSRGGCPAAGGSQAEAARGRWPDPGQKRAPSGPPPAPAPGRSLRRAQFRRPRRALPC